MYWWSSEAAVSIAQMDLDADAIRGDQISNVVFVQITNDELNDVNPAVKDVPRRKLPVAEAQVHSNSTHRTVTHCYVRLIILVEISNFNSAWVARSRNHSMRQKTSIQKTQKSVNGRNALTNYDEIRWMIAIQIT